MRIALAILGLGIAATLGASCRIDGSQSTVSTEGVPLVFSASNGGPGVSASERVTLMPDGVVVYTTNGPLEFDWKTQNRVGEFSTHVDRAMYAALSDRVRRAAQQAPK